MNVNDLDLGIVLEVFAQFGYIHVHAPAIEISVATPYLLQRLFARQKIIEMFGKHF